jgi:hypothetical protein
LPSSTLESMVDRLTMIVQELVTMIDGTGVGIGAGAYLAGNVTFADTAARALAVPSRVGQYGYQIDDESHWVSSGITAGQWVSAIPAKCVLVLNPTPDGDGNVTASTADGTLTTKLAYIP